MHTAFSLFFLPHSSFTSSSKPPFGCALFTPRWSHKQAVLTQQSLQCKWLSVSHSLRAADTARSWFTILLSTSATATYPPSDVMQRTALVITFMHSCGYLKQSNKSFSRTGRTDHNLAIHLRDSRVADRSFFLDHSVCARLPFQCSCHV